MKTVTLRLLLGLASASAISLASQSAAAGTLTMPGIDYSLSGYSTTYDPHACMTDFYGGVVNFCADVQTSYFNVPMIKSGTKTITISSTDHYFTTGLTCYAYEVAITAGILATATLTFTAAAQTMQTTIPYKAGSTAIQLSCNIPPNAGIAAVTWTD